MFKTRKRKKSSILELKQEYCFLFKNLWELSNVEQYRAAYDVNKRRAWKNCKLMATLDPLIHNNSNYSGIIVKTFTAGENRIQGFYYLLKI